MGVRAAVAALPLLLLCPSLAAAVEGESTLSVAPVFSSLTIDEDGDDVSGVGGGLVMDYGRALSDTFWLRLAVGGAVHDGGLLNGTATLGLTHTIDVLKYVPYVGLGIGVTVVGGDPIATKAKPYVELGVGLDVLQSPSWSWGLDARMSSFASGIVLLTIGPRLSWRWGYF